MNWWERLMQLLELLSHSQKIQGDPPVPSAPPAPTPAPAKPPAPKRTPWTLLVYMAGDNGRIFSTASGQMKLMEEMTSAGYRDLAEMGAIGSTDNVNVLCLFDSVDGTFLINVKRGSGFSDSVVRKVPSVNTGDPETLSQFVRHSATAHPAERYGLILWNHGTGWIDVDHYQVVRSPDPLRPPRGTLFRTTPNKLRAARGTRPIAYDDSSMDFLDARDLRSALASACSAIGGRFTFVGMDACLMAMIEGAHELAPYAEYFVASQEVEPMAGWPYAAILEVIDTRAGEPGAGVAAAVVDAYTKTYGGLTRSQTVTQSAIALDATTHTEALCSTLVAAILDSRSPQLRKAVEQARDEAQAFQDRSFRDLGDFAAKLAERELARTGAGG